MNKTKPDAPQVFRMPLNGRGYLIHADLTLSGNAEIFLNSKLPVREQRRTLRELTVGFRRDPWKCITIQ